MTLEAAPSPRYKVPLIINKNNTKIQHFEAGIQIIF
jgi:hypothetical protein